MKLLDGSEIVGYIKERQAKQVRALRQSWKVFPKLAILRTGDSPVTDTYLRIKKRYGEDIMVDVDIYNLEGDLLIDQIIRLNLDDSVHGIVVQLPIGDKEFTEEVVNAVASSKDVDGLNEKSDYFSATATAISWLLNAYDVQLENKKIAIVGRGRLVGSPLYKLWTSSNLDVEMYGSTTENLPEKIRAADIIVSATGVPGLIKEKDLKLRAVVVDAGTASEKGKVVGDVEASARERMDLIITPEKGGVGPLTIAALFDNVIIAARKVADKKGQQDL